MAFLNASLELLDFIFCWAFSTVAWIALRFSGVLNVASCMAVLPPVDLLNQIRVAHLFQFCRRECVAHLNAA
jgi:hypothetical protein